MDALIGARIERATAGSFAWVRVPLSAALLLAMALSTAIWPTFTLAAGVLGAIAYLAVVAPEYAFVIGVALYGVEGTIKSRLQLELSPLPFDQVAVGALMLDTGLLFGAAGLVVRERSRLRASWTRLPLLGRLGVLSLSAWLLASVPQIVQSGDAVRGTAGFRVTQSYVLAALAGLVLVSRRRSGSRALTVLLLLGGAVAGYAAVRGIVGPSAVERAFAISKETVTFYGGAFRNVGSFSGAVGLTSFLVPVAVFAFALAVLVPRYRVLGGAVFASALIGVVTSYTRAGVIALGAGVVLAGALSLPAARLAASRKLVAVGAVALGLTGIVAGTALATQASPQIRERARGFVDPLADPSFRVRLRTWGDSLRAIEAEPLGSGLGTVGRASSLSGPPETTTDNSYLKILREQGVLVGLLFVLGVLAMCTALVRGIRRAPPGSRAIPAAATSAFASFLVLAFAGEYVEQPGKVVAWTLLGVGVGGLVVGSGKHRESTRRNGSGDLPRRAAKPATSVYLRWAIVALCFCTLPVAVNAGRRAEFGASFDASLLYETSGSDESAHVQSLLRDPFVAPATVRRAGVLISERELWRNVTLQSTSRNVRVTVRASPPERANALANALGKALTRAASRHLQAQARSQLQAVRRRMRSPAVSVFERTWLLPRREALEEFIARPVSAIVVRPHALAVPPSGFVDRLVGRLPGPFPPKPQRLWAVSAGLLLALLLCGLWCFRARVRPAGAPGY